MNKPAVQEVALVFGTSREAIHWHEPLGRSQVEIPDSEGLWDVLWKRKADVLGVAHTHPWSGKAWPSYTDITTFRAIEVGLGKLLLWPIVTFDNARFFAYNPITISYTEITPTFLNEDWWTNLVEEMRQKSRGG